MKLVKIHLQIFVQSWSTCFPVYSLYFVLNDQTSYQKSGFFFFFFLWFGSSESRQNPTGFPLLGSVKAQTVQRAYARCPRDLGSEGHKIIHCGYDFAKRNALCPTTCAVGRTERVKGIPRAFTFQITKAFLLRAASKLERCDKGLISFFSFEQ